MSRRIIIVKDGEIIYDEPVDTLGCKHTVIGDVEVLDCTEEAAKYERKVREEGYEYDIPDSLDNGQEDTE